MTTRRRNQAEAAQVRRRGPSGLQLVPRTVISAAEQSMVGARSTLLRNIDLPPALALLTGVAIIALVCIIYLGQVTAVSNANYALQALQNEHTLLLREQQDLLPQIGRAQSLGTIETIARDKLKMVPLDDRYEYITIAEGPPTAMPPLPTPELATPTPPTGAGP
jgi:hypothetical protein